MTKRSIFLVLLGLATIAACTSDPASPTRVSSSVTRPATPEASPVPQVMPAPQVPPASQVPDDGPRLGGKTLVRGCVSDQDDKPVADHEVWLVDTTMGAMIRAKPAYLCEEDLKETVAKTRTNAQGRYEFEEVPTGKWYVGVAPVSTGSASSGRGDVAPLSVRFRIVEEEGAEGEGEEEGEEEVEGRAERELTVDVKTHRGLELRGRVLLPDGKSAAGCLVSALIDRLFTFATASTDERGVFVIGALAPGDVWLKASGPGLIADSEFTLVQAGNVDVALRLEPAGAISGSIVDRETRQPVPATLFVTQRGAAIGCSQRPGTTSEFQLEKLEPGIYDLSASSTDGRIGVARGIAVRNDVHERGIAIELAPGGRLTLKYDRADAGASFRIFSQEACLGWITVQRGQSATQIVPPGSIRIVEMRTGGGIDRVVEVQAGQEQTVLLGEK